MKNISHQKSYQNFMEQLEQKSKDPLIKDILQNQIHKGKQKCVKIINRSLNTKSSQKILRQSTKDNQKSNQDKSSIKRYENFDFYPYHKSQCQKKREKVIPNSRAIPVRVCHSNSSEKIKTICKRVKVPLVCSNNTSISNQMQNALQQTDRVQTLKTQGKQQKQEKTCSMLNSYQLFSRQKQNYTQKKAKKPAKTKVKLITSYNNSNTKKKDDQVSEKYQNQVKSHKQTLKYSYKKFLHEVTEKLSSIIKMNKQEQFLQHKISYIEFLQCLKALKMIKETYEPYPHDLVSSLWSQFISNKSVSNFIITVSSILKFQNQNNNMEIVNSDDFYLQRKFSDMRMLRLQISGCHFISKKNQQQNKCSYSDISDFHEPIFSNRYLKQKNKDFTFKPTINRRSQELAKSKSNSRLNKSGKNTDKCVRDEYLQPNNANRRFKTDAFEDQLCSLNFGDTINILKHDENDKFCNFLRKEQCMSKGDRRSQILYEQGKSKSRQKKQKMRSKNDEQYQRNKHQLTFKPKISNYNQSLLIKKPYQRIKGEQNSLNRILKGRIQKQVKQVMIQKGLPFNQKTFSKIKKQKYQQLFMKKYGRDSNFYQNQLEVYQANESNLNIQMINSYLKTMQQTQKHKDTQIIPTQTQQMKIRSHNKNITEQQKDDQEQFEQNQGQKAHTNSFQQQFSQQNQSLPTNRLTNRDIVIVSIFVEQDKPEQLVYHKKYETIRQAAQKFAKKHNLGYKQLEKLAKQLHNIVKHEQLSLIKEESEESLEQDFK